MQTGVFRIPKPEATRRTLRGVLVLVPYCIIAVILAMALVVASEQTQPIQRGTLGWLQRHGMDLRAFGLYIALTAGIGTLFWRKARRRWLSSIGLLFFVMTPYLFYTACATYYLTTEGMSSGVAIVIYWGGYIFGFLLVTLISVLLTWLEVANFRGGG